MVVLVLSPVKLSMFYHFSCELKLQLSVLNNHINTVFQEGEVDALAVVHSYEDGKPAGSHKTRLTALNVLL